MQKSIIERLKDQKEHSTALLTPWLRMSVGKSTAAQNDSGTLKFLPGLRKNLPLTQNSSNIIQRQGHDKFSRIISQKYQEVKDLIPLVPKIERSQGFWGELERIFPSSAADRYEEPAQPGEMRSGTIIQKMDPFPKPGQTLSNFKEQSEPLFSRSRKKETEPLKKPAVIPGQRLFSRVTEINPKGQPENIVEEPAAEPAKQDHFIEKIKDHELPLQTPDVTEDEQVDRAKEVEALSKALESSAWSKKSPAQLPEPHTHTEESSAFTAKEPPVHTKMPPARGLKTPSAETESPAQIKEPASSMQQDIAHLQEPAAKEPSSFAMPLPQGRPEHVKPIETRTAPQPAPKAAAVPVKKAAPLPPAHMELPKAKPVMKADASNPEAKRNAPLSTTPHDTSFLHTRSNPIAGKVVQRTLDLPQNQDTDEAQSPMSQILPLKTASRDLPEKTEEPSLLLRKDVGQQKKFAKTVERKASIFPNKSLARASLVDQQKLPLLAPQKYRQSNEEYTLPEIGSQRIEIPQTSSLSNQPTVLALAQSKPVEPFLPKKSSESVHAQPQVAQPAIPVVEPVTPFTRQTLPLVPNVPQRFSAPAQSAASNVVQRASASDNEVSTPAPAAPNYSQLAEDVFPFVKHLLEIENERTRGSFR